MNAATLNGQVDRQLECLRREFEGVIAARDVTDIGEKYFDKLRADARIDDFIPVLVYRFTRAELAEVRREDLHHAA